jgi:predicted ribosome-associated RNA-binding protein Tma20
MKFIKFSKTGWLILATGIFIVVLAGLGITRSGQLQEQGKIKDELSISQKTLSNLQVKDLIKQLDELQQKADEGQVQLNEAKQKLDQTLVSVEVTDEFFSIATYCGVKVMSISTSPIIPNAFEGIGLDTTSVTAVAEGALPDLINFVVSINNDFTTGLVQSTQINIPPPDSGDTPSASVQVIVYSYKG